ncbi:MAG: selenocysteine-specific translation elongation factor [bacterium]
MEKRITLGTAGHIDHGKTALVKALTGIDTDRLKEEKERGITIELGFASLALDSGIRLGIVDMPGHERFIDHMVAGASGIDLVLLVVAADEAVMPQTVEHLEICRLLGVQSGLVALTKIDLVDEETLALAREDVAELVRGTFLESKPVVPFSSVTGEGRKELLGALGALAREVSAKRQEGAARMPIDRVFTMKGFGTVVTGTLLAGKLTLGESIEVLPSGHRAKIRGIQVHNASVKESMAGSRTAVNLQGVEKSSIARGEVLVKPDSFEPSQRIYAHLHYLPQNRKELPDRFRLVVHWGTTRVFGRVALIDPAPLEPGKSAFAQLRLEAPLLPVFGDRFVIRDFSTNRTLGGGVILDPQAEPYRRRIKEDLLPWLRKLQGEAPQERIRYFLWKQGKRGDSASRLAVRSQLGVDDCLKLCRELAERGELVEYETESHAFTLRDRFESLCRETLEAIAAFHRENPYQEGMPKEALRGRVSEPVPEKLASLCLSRLVEKGEIAVVRDKVRLAGHEARLSDEDTKLREDVLRRITEGAAMPPSVRELAAETACPEPRLKNLLDFLAGAEEVVKVAEDLYFARSVLDDLRTRLVRHLEEKGEIQPGDFKTLSQATRKYTIPLLEYFDRIRITLRKGDVRVLRERKS